MEWYIKRYNCRTCNQLPRPFQQLPLIQSTALLVQTLQLLKQIAAVAQRHDEANADFCAFAVKEKIVVFANTVVVQLEQHL